MDQQAIYKQAVDVACQIVLDEGGNIYIKEIARRMSMDPVVLEQNIGSRRDFSAQVTVTLGARIWAREAEIFGRVVESDKYRAMTGARQIKELFSGAFLYSYRGHPEFWRWLHRFEAFIQSEKIPPERLAEYQNQLEAFYPVFLAAFEKGQGDGTIRPEVRPEDYYYSVTQALMSICLKYCAAPIIATDSVELGDRLLTTVIDMAIHYLRR